MMSHSSSSSIPISAAFLCLLAASAGFPLVAAAAAENNINVTVDQLYGKLTSTTAASPGFNAEGTSVFTNYVDALNKRQLFILRTISNVREKPESKTLQWSGLNWCSDLTFPDFINGSSKLAAGFTGRCVLMPMSGYAAYVEALAEGAQVNNLWKKDGFFASEGISSVYVEQLNVFEGQLHKDTDDFVIRFWDSGRNTMPQIAWEGHDEGDMHPNAATSSFSNFGEFTWMSVEEIAPLFNMTAAEAADKFTPEKFKQVYLDTWIKDHEEEAEKMNPNPGPELEIIEQVKNETNSADDTTTTPVQPDSTAEDGGSDDANPVEDESGSGRHFVSIGARFVSTALCVFGM